MVDQQPDAHAPIDYDARALTWGTVSFVASLSSATVLLMTFLPAIFPVLAHMPLLDDALFLPFANHCIEFIVIGVPLSFIAAAISYIQNSHAPAWNKQALWRASIGSVIACINAMIAITITWIVISNFH